MFTLTQVLWLVVLFMIVAGLASGWIMFMVGVKVTDKDADRRLEDLAYQFYVSDTAHEELLQQVWGWSFGDQSTVTVHVRRLREKVEVDPTMPERLVTVWGVGYRWEPR